MALKYQALNGTFISKTITIQGPDITKRGTPLICNSISSDWIYYGINSDVASSYSLKKTSYSSTITLTGCSHCNISNDNVLGIAASSTGACSIVFKHRTAPYSASIKGTATWVLVSSSGEISTQTLPVNQSNITGYLIFQKPEDNKFLVSFTFEPTE